MNRFGHWLPVIAVAERPQTESVVRAIKAGALDYLVLPHEIAPLNEAIERAAREADNHRAHRARAADARQRIARLSLRERGCSIAWPMDAATRPSRANSISVRARSKFTA
jgi:FixJ family two-component response regulator